MPDEDYKCCVGCGARMPRTNYPNAYKWRLVRFCTSGCSAKWRARNVPRPSLRERLEANVDRSTGHGPNGDCHEWVASTNTNGYGQMIWEGKLRLVHRVAMFLELGEWPSLHVCHHCDNPRCVRLEHLFLGTAADNARDRDAKGRTRILRGEEHGAAKLNAAQAAEIRSLRGMEVQRVTADRYNITQVQVSAIQRGKRWAKL